MADDVVVQNLYNFICISGGFVELPVLLKNDSPLGSRISELDAKNSLTTQAGRPFVAVKDCYGDGITGVRIDLRKKICQQYIGKGSCRRAQGKCKFWHICKSFIEGNCAGKCNLSHNFFDEHNKTKAEELALEKFSNETIKNVVAWSLPQVCQLYLKNECKSDECLYLHVCATAVQGLEGGSPCHCPLSHSLIDSHNKKILKQYDLVPHPSMKVEFVRCSILVPKEQSVFDKSKCSREASATGGKVTNTPSSSKHGEYESSFQVKTGMDKKCRKRKPLQDKASEQEPICRPVGTINPVNKDSLEFLNTETGEKGNCMDPCSDEYKSANFSFKDVRHVKEGDLNAAKKGQKKPKMAAQSRDGAVKSKSAELDKDQEGRRTCNESHQRSLDCANAVKVSTKESKMITAQTSDGAVKSSEVMKVEKEQCGCLTRKDFQKKRLEDANAVNRCRPKSKMATAQSSDDAVKRNAKEVVEDKEVYQTRIESQQKRLQNGNVARSPQESKTTTKKLVGTANAKVKEGKKDQESGETRNASQQKRFQGENIVKKSSQESTMATTVANGQGGALTNTEFQQKILYDSNAVKSTRQKSKMTTAQSSDGAVKRNAKEVVKDKEDGQTRIESQQKILDSAVKVTGAEKAERDQYAGLTRNGLQQRSIHEANAVKRSWQKSNVTTSQSSDCAVKAKVMGVKKDGGSGNTCNGLQQRNLFDANAVKRSPQLQECNMTATQSSGDAVKANVREVQNDDGSGQACKESQERSLDQRHVVVQSSQQSITTTEKLSEAAKAKFKVVEEDEGIGQTRNKSHHRLDDANAVKKGRQGCKMSITEGLDSTVKGAVREVKKDQDYSQIRNESQQESLDHGHVMERISQESLTTTENLSEATKPKVKVKTKGREGGQSRKTSVQKSLGGTNSAKRHQQESRTNNNQSSDEAVKAKVKEVKKDERGDQTRRESRQKSLDDRNAVERGSHGFMTNAKTLSGAAKAKNVEEKRDQEGGNKSEHKSLDGTNALKRGRQETMSTTTLSSDELVKAKVKEVKRDREGSQIRIESQPKSLGGAHTMKNSRQKSVTTTQLSSDGAEKDHEGGQTRNESQQGIFDDEHAAMRSRQESKITTKSLTGAMKAKVKEGEKDHERSQIHNEIQQKGLDDVDAVQRSQLESKTTTKKLGGYFKATVEEVGIDSGVVPTHNEPLEKLLQDKNAGKRRRKKSKMTAQGFVTSIKEMQKCTEAYQTCSETKQKSLEASRDPKDVNTASETHVTGGQSDNPTMRAPGSELPSGLLTVDSSREFFNTSSSTLPASQEVYVDTQQNEPISSSCSSVQDPKKCTPSKKAVFECILKEYDGSVSFDAISKRQDLFPDGCGDIVSWFEARNDRFFLRKKEGTILEVSVFCRGAKLCFNQMCSKKDCQYFHVCKEYIAGFCRFGCGCQRNHSFQYDEDRKFISKRKLGGLTHEELRKVLKLSMPQVCFDYNEGCCTRGLSCNKIHICEDFTTSRCEGEEHCGLQHENAFVTLHTTAILRNYGLKLKDDNVNLVRKMLLFCEDIPSGYRNRPSSKIVACKDLSISSKGASAATSFEPSAVEVFECLCKEYNCSASLSVISKRTDLFPSAFDDIESWFRKKKDRFRITEDQQGEILQVHAFSTKARVCLGYNAYYGECKREKCPYLHVCRKYITNSSSNGASCPRNHHFQDEREKSLLSKFKFDQLTDEQLRRLVLSSTPRVCEDYNNGMCGRGDSCDKIHICSDHMTKCHREGCGCYLDHESAMATEHTRAILKRYLQDHLTSDILKKIILVCDQPPKRKEAGHIHQRKPDAPICSDFLLRKCKQGLKCPGHHCRLPFHWQYRLAEDAEWKGFSEQDNEKLEKMYRDPTLEECSAAGFEIHVDSKEVLRLDRVHEVYFLLDSKVMILQYEFYFQIIADLRRLSTECYIADPDNTLATQWIWYCEDENGIWRQYDQDHTGKDLQRSLEEALFNRTNRFSFRIADQDYTLNFLPTSDMSQTNVKYGTTRKVRRRPAKGISKDDIRGLKRYDDVLSAKGQLEKNARGTKVPRHWPSKPSDTKCKGVALAPLSAEFKEVEKQFRKSIKGSVVIIGIERVQNTLMWKEYHERKNGYTLAMKTGSSKRKFLTERRLCDGVKPKTSTAKAACKQSFGWRMKCTYVCTFSRNKHNHRVRRRDLLRFDFLSKQPLPQARPYIKK